jgi:hypothetical protein
MFTACVCECTEIDLQLKADTGRYKKIMQHYEHGRVGNATTCVSMKKRCHACTKSYDSYEGLSFDSFDA